MVHGIKKLDEDDSRDIVDKIKKITDAIDKENEQIKNEQYKINQL